MSSEAKLYLLVKNEDFTYKIAKIIINSHKGEIYYIPSENNVLDSSLKLSCNKINKFSFHSSGRVNATTSENNVIEFGLGEVEKDVSKTRIKIEDTGYQDLVIETVNNIKALPKFNKKIKDNDIILNANSHKGSIVIKFSLVSGKNIVAYYEGKRSGIKHANKKNEKLILDSDWRGFSKKKGLSDKTIQFLLIKSNHNLININRRTILPLCQKITSKIQDQLKQ